MLRACFVLILALVAACANSAPATAPEAAPVVAEAPVERAIIATLATRDQRLRIFEGGTFDLLDADGTVLATGLTEAQLREQHPEAFETYRTAIADGVLPVMADVEPSATAP